MWILTLSAWGLCLGVDLHSLGPRSGEAQVAGLATLEVPAAASISLWAPHPVCLSCTLFLCWQASLGAEVFTKLLWARSRALPPSLHFLLPILGLDPCIVFMWLFQPLQLPLLVTHTHLSSWNSCPINSVFALRTEANFKLICTSGPLLLQSLLPVHPHGQP